MKYELIEALKKHGDKTFTVTQLIQIIGAARTDPPGVMTDEQFEEFKLAICNPLTPKSVANWHKAATSQAKSYIISELIGAAEAKGTEDEFEFLTIPELQEMADGASQEVSGGHEDSVTTSE